ncbi:hypothetical protein CYMTET_3717 [Cymbomonas tetramitiformis]|uniref:Glutathione S-transferase n=1 Tax=Cymbomonas tetramitiformis TaxID=36881 RepID=A0AAE0H2I7_9CHLO|nr:hypothetical protein CYMTET_3717 [Cymbomonas tetramitiformis]
MSTMLSQSVATLTASSYLHRPKRGLPRIVQRVPTRGVKSTLRRVVCSADYELLYFDARGAAETSRILFAVSGVQYEDSRYKFSFVEGKPKVEDRHAEDKAAGRFEANLDRLPVLKVNGSAIGQSKAIERYLAQEFGLAGSNSIQAAQIDAYCEHVRDISTAYGKERGSPFAPMSDETKEKIEKWFAETLPGWFERLEKATGPDGFAVGEKLSLADVCLHQLVTAGTMGSDERSLASLCEYPKLDAVVKQVH